VLDLACGSGYGSEIMIKTAASVHGVDSDAPSVDLAAATIGQRTAATFEIADGVEFLGRELGGSYDMIVCFEGLEHMLDLSTAVSRLAHHVNEGVQLVFSLLNSRAFEQDNPFHVTNFGYQQAAALVSELPGAITLQQYLAEGSLICAQGCDELDAKLLHIERVEPEYADYFLAIVNVDEALVARAHSSRLLLLEAPAHNRYMRNLELANRELRRRNNELARKMFNHAALDSAKAGSAASSFVASRVRELEAVVERKVEEIAARDRDLAARDRDLAQREDMILAQRHELLRLRQQVVAAAELASAHGADSGAA
jgi:cyclopropane fatty-acyl-phospholipid synthase-like methyltransferase